MLPDSRPTSGVPDHASLFQVLGETAGGPCVDQIGEGFEAVHARIIAKRNTSVNAFRNIHPMDIRAMTITNRNTMVSRTETPADRLRLARIAAGYRTQQEFSDKNSLSQSTYNLHETGKRGLRQEVAEDYARLLGNCSAAWLLFGTGDRPNGLNPKDERTTGNQSFLNHDDPTLLEEANAEQIESNVISAPNAALPPPATSMPKDVPVLGTAECGPDGVFEMNGGEAIDYVRRPPGLMGNRKAFAVFSQGTSMEPMFFAGDPIYIDPNRPPVVGRAVLIEFKPTDHENPRGMLKILVAMNSEFVLLRQLNPDNSAKPMKFARAKIKHIYRVLTNQDMMGI